MIKIRKSEERGHFNFGWLDTYHTFSFGDYWDPEYTGFRDLRVINEDRVIPGGGFPMHSHQDMEIVTYILEGALEHKDNLGHGSVIGPGEIQRMSAGTGITHSEFNASKSEEVHLLQIWIHPEKNNIAPGYEQKNFTQDQKRGKFALVASPDSAEGSVRVHQDVRLFAALLKAGEEAKISLKPRRYAWVQVALGAVVLNGQELKQSDGAAVSDEMALQFSAKKDCEILLFDLA